MDAAQQREQVLQAFSQRAKSEGIRAVMMGELARELRMSAATLYKLYPSKEALVLACVDRWAREVAAQDAAEPDPTARRDPFDQFTHWLQAWADANAEISPAFARDLRSDYPAAFERYRAVIRERQERGAALLRPALKPEIDQRVAFAVLEMLLEEVLRPELPDRLHLSRHEVIRSAMAIWAGGAIDRRGRLRAIDGEQEEASSEGPTSRASRERHESTENTGTTKPSGPGTRRAR